MPNYTTLSRRAQELQVTLPEMSSGDPIHLVVDSTGVKLYGEGEWKVRKHGYSKRRTWRKVHLGLDVKTGQIRAALMTHQDVDDASALPGLLAQIPADESIDTTGGDGAYDSKQCHKGNRRARRYAVDSAARRSEALVEGHTRSKLAQ